MTEGDDSRTYGNPASGGAGAAHLPVEDFRILFDQSLAGIAEIDLGTLRYVRVNRAFERMIGYSHAELAELSVLDVTHPDDLDEQARVLRTPRDPDDPSFTNEKRYIRKDGAVLWVRVDATVIFGAENRPARCIAVVTDMTRSRVAEAALAASEERLRLALEASDTGVFDRDERTGHSVRIGGFYRRFACESAVGSAVPARVHAMMLPGDHERIEQAFRALRKTGEPSHFEFRIQPPGEDVRHYRVFARAVRDQHGRLLRTLGTVVDMTEIRATEAALHKLNDELERRVDERTADLRHANRRLADEVQRREATQAALVQSQKLEALGKLTSGIAHDFNNVIMAISGGFSVIARRSEDKRLIEVAEHGVRAAERGGKLVKKLLAFARQQDVAPETVDLGLLLDEARPLLERSAGSGVSVRVSVPPGLPPARVDPPMLESALINLAVNARDAVDGRGALEIAVSLLQRGEVHWPDDLGGDAALCIRVSDNGRGMPAEVLARVTEPFFTTKAPGQGTGMGLAMVAGFANESGGALRIESREGAGTDVFLYLPVADAAVADA